MKRPLIYTVAGALVVLLVMLSACSDGPKAGEVKDEALLAGRMAKSLPGSENDYLADMDYGVTKDPEEVRRRLDPYVPGISADEAVKAVVRGRNNWNIWSAGNDRLWDELGNLAFGNLDLVKTLSNHPELGYSRDNRWAWLGLVNEPCFLKGDGPREDRYGLWLDVRDPNCPPDPFEDEEKYPGVEYGERGKNVAAGSYYGYASGILGLRLFTNPYFTAEEEAKWDPERYYTDPTYYNDDKLVRPYRVGMSCGFCHIGPNPSRPPTDVENPTYANLNSNPGAQYFWIERIFVWNAWAGREDDNFIYQLFHTSRPGALDTSLVSSDNINNPRTMNAIYNLGARATLGAKWGKEKLEGGNENNKQFADFSPPLPPTSPLIGLSDKPATVFTPHILKDGADSVGVLGALNRVYINIGLFSEEWLLHFKPLIGGPNITPIPIAHAEKNSTYWNANVLQTPDTALFFLATATPDYLEKAPGGPELVLPEDDPKLVRGKEVFSGRCARCHSSKLPQRAFDEFFPDRGCVNENYLECFGDYWAWTKTEEFRASMKEIVLAPDFREDNFLSTELRIPVTLLETQACSPLAANALKGNIWDNFSSESYKNLPAVGSVLVHDPWTGAPSEYEMPGGGRGYTRVPSLVSLWSTAPYLLNNSLGPFEWEGSVEARLTSFDSSIRQLLWPETRDGDMKFLTRSGKEVPGVIDRTTTRSYLSISTGFLPDFLKPLEGLLSRWLPFLFGGEGLQIGPIPKGTPVDLLANLDTTGEQAGKLDLLSLLIRIKKDLKAIPENATDEEAREIFSNLVEPLMADNRCVDFVVNRGHYFGTDYLPESEGEPGLTDDDKEALIEFLKTL